MLRVASRASATGNRSTRSVLGPVCIVLPLLLGGVWTAAQSEAPTQPIDLAGSAKITRAVAPDTAYRLIIRNVAPGRKYEYEIRRVVHGIDPMPKLTTVFAGGQDSCNSLTEALGHLQDEKLEEEDVATKAAAVERALAGCLNQDLIAAAKKIVSRTTVELGLTAVRRGETVVATVSRPGRSWTTTLDGGRRGEWLGSYGFVYSPPGGEQYAAKAIDGGRFQVTKLQDVKGWTFTPLAFYSWMPASMANSSFGVGLTGGLGFKNDRPAVTAGASLFYNRNLTFVGGVLIRSVSQLNREYDPNALPIVGENLSDDQLHSWGYRATVFVGVAFRFSENPFSTPGNGSAGKTEGAK